MEAAASVNPGQWQELTKETLLLGPVPQAAYDQGRVLTELMQQPNREVIKLKKLQTDLQAEHTVAEAQQEAALGAPSRHHGGTW